MSQIKLSPTRTRPNPSLARAFPPLWLNPLSAAQCITINRPLLPAGLNAGDEILQLNGKDSHSLNFSDMKAAFTKASLSLTVNTLPATDRRQLCYLPPRRSDAEDDLYTDIFSQSQGQGSTRRLHFADSFYPNGLHDTLAENIESMQEQSE